MYEQVEKWKENKNRSVANSVTQMKDNRKQGFEFLDNRTQKSIIQCHAYWAVDNNDRPVNPIPQDNQPEGTRFIQRDGGGINHELYNTARSAKRSAARYAPVQGSNLATRMVTDGNETGRGIYRFNTAESAEGEIILPAITNCVMKHDQDENAILSLYHHNGALDRTVIKVKHFHAYTYNQGTNINSNGSSAELPHGNARLGPEHIFVNPFNG